MGAVVGCLRQSTAVLDVVCVRVYVLLSLLLLLLCSPRRKAPRPCCGRQPVLHQSHGTGGGSAAGPRPLAAGHD